MPHLSSNSTTGASSVSGRYKTAAVNTNTNNGNTKANADGDECDKDETLLFNHEEDSEADKNSENFTEDKKDLIHVAESAVEKGGVTFSNSNKTLSNRPSSEHSSIFGKLDSTALSPQSAIVSTQSSSAFNMGYIVSPYPYPNGSTAPIPVSVASKMGLAAAAAGAALPFFCHNGDQFTQPPPAHMGIPPYQLETPRNATSAIGLTRPPMYPFAASQYTYSMLSSEMSQVAASWHSTGMYTIPTTGPGFRSPYPSTLPIATSSFPGDLYRFSPSDLNSPHHSLPTHASHSHPLLSHPAIVIPGSKQDHSNLIVNNLNHRSSSTDNSIKGSMNRDKTNNSSSANSNHHSHQQQQQHHQSQSQPQQHIHQHQHQNQHHNQHQHQHQLHPDNNNVVDKKKPHIKKPLNAFMLYMKEMRAKVVAECTLKESAAINQILGRKWHSLKHEEQAKYYEKARQERHIHMQLYPGWSARDNYGYGTKKKKRKKERITIDSGGNNMKKCRARFGLDQQSQWCKPCRRKKKCIRYLEMNEVRESNGILVMNNNNNNNNHQLNENGNPCSCDNSPDDNNTTAADDDSAGSLTQSLSSPMSSNLSRISSLTSPSMILPSPSTSHASPAISLPSPYMTSMNSPLNSHDSFENKITTNTAALNAVSIVGISLPLVHRNPVGTNPHDINNPLSVNQLTAQYNKSCLPMTQ